MNLQISRKVVEKLSFKYVNDELNEHEADGQAQAESAPALSLLQQHSHGVHGVMSQMCAE